MRDEYLRRIAEIEAARKAAVQMGGADAVALLGVSARHQKATEQECAF